MSFELDRKSLALSLFDIGAVRFGAFRLKLHDKNPAEPLSPIYFNLRTSDNPKPGPLAQPVVHLIALLLHRLCQDHSVTFLHVTGVPNAGNPLAEAFYQSHLFSKTGSLITLKKQDTPRRVVGILSGKFNPGETVLVLDDLVTQADSKLEAIEVLERAGLAVKDLLVIIDREQGGSEGLRRAGYKLHSLFRLVELLDIYVGAGFIDTEQRAEVLKYVKKVPTKKVPTTF